MTAPQSDSVIVRWLWIWITIGILVVVVVIGFLLGIVRALGSIDDGLEEAAMSVKSVQGDADPLPNSLQRINTALGSIDKALLPIRGQADDIGGGLGRIRDSLRLIDGSLKDTNGSLVNTNGSLANTAGALVGVAGLTTDIDRSLQDTTGLLNSVLDSARVIQDTLVKAERKDSQGTELIPINVREVNDVLDPAEDDLRDIVGKLRDVNQNLTAICQSPLLTLLPPMMC